LGKAPLGHIDMNRFTMASNARKLVDVNRLEQTNGCDGLRHRTTV
jgi:hypothetical protein